MALSPEDVTPVQWIRFAPATDFWADSGGLFLVPRTMPACVPPSHAADLDGDCTTANCAGYWAIEFALEGDTVPGLLGLLRIGLLLHRRVARDELYAVRSYRGAVVATKEATAHSRSH